MIVYCGTNWILQIGCHKEMDSGYLVVHQVNQLSQGLHRLQINHKMSTGHLYQQTAVYLPVNILHTNSAMINGCMLFQALQPRVAQPTRRHQGLSETQGHSLCPSHCCCTL